MISLCFNNMINTLLVEMYDKILQFMYILVIVYAHAMEGFEEPNNIGEQFSLQIKQKLTDSEKFTIHFLFHTSYSYSL